MAVPLSYYLILSGFVFLTGVVGVLIRRNIIVILLSVELMLNATNINFVAFSEYRKGKQRKIQNKNKERKKK